MNISRVFAGLISLFVLVSFSQAAEETTGRILVSTDGISQITLPPGWDEQKELNDTAVIQAADPQAERYVIVITDSKEDFEQMNVEKHSEITRTNLMKSLSNPSADGPVRLTINDCPAVQYEVRGAIDNLNIIYIHTTIETTGHYHQVLAWTLRSKIDKNREPLQQVVKSFRATAKATVK
jgi:hypothetical protein